MQIVTVQFPISVEIPTNVIDWGLNETRHGVYEAVDRLTKALKQALGTHGRKESWAIMKKALKKDEKYIINVTETMGIAQEILCMNHPDWLKM